jgi:HTH-type transcriptional regulator/antitoxin HigA
MIESTPTFTPDWISPPGDTITDLLEERNWSPAELARRTGYTIQHINSLISGKATLTSDTAFCLEQVLGGKASFWLKREALYREQLAHWAEEPVRLPHSA